MVTGRARTMVTGRARTVARIRTWVKPWVWQDPPLPYPAELAQPGVGVRLRVRLGLGLTFSILDLG